MITKKYFEQEQKGTIRFLAWKSEYGKGKVFTSFLSNGCIHNILMPSNFFPPRFVEAMKISEEERENFKIILYKFVQYVNKISSLPRCYGIIVRKVPERVFVDKRKNITRIPCRYSVLTTDDKKFCVATSFVDCNIHDIVELLIDSEIEKEEKKSLRGVITRKIDFDDGLKKISDNFISLDEFFKNIEKKK